MSRAIQILIAAALVLGLGYGTVLFVQHQADRSATIRQQEQAERARQAAAEAERKAQATQEVQAAEEAQAQAAEEAQAQAEAKRKARAAYRQERRAWKEQIQFCLREEGARPEDCDYAPPIPPE